MRGILFTILVLFFCGCFINPNLSNHRNVSANADEPESESAPAPETLSGIYEVNIRETENTCNSPENTRINGWFWMTVITQERTEDDGFIVNISVASFSWFRTGVMPDGTIDTTTEASYDSSRNIVGILTLDEITATITMDSLFTPESANACHIIYELDGYLLFERAVRDSNDAQDNGDNGVERSSISGVYEIHVSQILNSCNSGVNYSIWDVWSWANVMMRERYEDDSCLVNILLNFWTSELSIQKLPVAVDGSVDFATGNSVVAGVITLNRLDLSIEQYYWLGENICAVFYVASGYPLLERTDFSE